MSIANLPTVDHSVHPPGPDTDALTLDELDREIAATRVYESIRQRNLDAIASGRRAYVRLPPGEIEQEVEVNRREVEEFRARRAELLELRQRLVRRASNPPAPTACIRRRAPARRPMVRAPRRRTVASASSTPTSARGPDEPPARPALASVVVALADAGSAR